MKILPGQLTVHPEEIRTVGFARSPLKLFFSNDRAVMRKREPEVASIRVTDLGTVLTVWNPAILANAAHEPLQFTVI